MQEQELLLKYRQLATADQQRLDTLLTTLVNTQSATYHRLLDKSPNASQEVSVFQTPKEVMQAWEAAFNQRDAYALAELYHEEAINLQVALGEPIQGKAAILRDALAFFQAFPDTFTHVEQLLQDGDWAMVEWIGGATWKGEFAGLLPNGRTYILRGCGFFHIVAGKIRFQRGYWDKVTWFGQLAIPLES